MGPQVSFFINLQPSSTMEPPVPTTPRLLDGVPPAAAGVWLPAHLQPPPPAPRSCVAPAGPAAFVPLFSPELVACGGPVGPGGSAAGAFVGGRGARRCVAGLHGGDESSRRARLDRHQWRLVRPAQCCRHGVSWEDAAKVHASRRARNVASSCARSPSLVPPDPIHRANNLGRPSLPFYSNRDACSSPHLQIRAGSRSSLLYFQATSTSRRSTWGA